MSEAQSNHQDDGSRLSLPGAVLSLPPHAPSSRPSTPLRSAAAATAAGSGSAFAPPSVSDLAAFRSKFIDVAQLPESHLGHVHKLLASRHARARAGPRLEAEAVAAAHEDALQHACSSTVGAEQSQRAGLSRAQDHARAEIERAAALAAELASGARGRRKEERRRKREIRRLEALKQQELRRAYLAAFKRGGQQPATEQAAAPTDEEQRHISDLNEATRRLRLLYSDSAPPFAADPADLWERGVVLPPDRQLSPQRKALAAGMPVAGQLPSESYHEFAARLRRSYWQTRIDREARAQEEAFLSARAGKAETAAPTCSQQAPGQPGYNYTLSRIRHELQHGPEHGGALAAELLSPTQRRPWR
eukprot:TRINITY_DN26641_c0_g1_i1.p1 TRINITY_DN26641_c0_g1~~TRINITY_DN26641_c0_g1_i1.p1  ORF type:complete len:361 (+),score=117.09 TRINITY_DN26641_c0_g1_i1:47-1129(+)